MDEDRDTSPGVEGFRSAAGWRAAACAAALLVLHTAGSHAAGPRRSFELPAGEATVTLNEFGRQSDLQVLFDFNLVRGIRTRSVSGELEASAALAAMLAGTNLRFEFVNERTLAVRPAARKTSSARRLWDRLTRSEPEPPVPRAREDLELVLISGSVETASQPLLGAQTIQLTRTDIDRSGLATVEDFLHTLPEVFGGGPNENTVLGREAGTNSSRGSGVNLRGLDAGATLIMLDGKRLPPSGTAGVFQDVTNLPLSIVDHVDVMPDGSSARYGADAIGGVVNFVTRANFYGMQTEVREGSVTEGSMGQQQLSHLLGGHWDGGSGLLGFEYFKQDALRARDRLQETSDLTSFGGSNFNAYYGSPGTIQIGSVLYPLPKGQNGRSLTAADLAPGPPNLYDVNQGADITPAERRLSGFAKLSQALTGDLNLFAEGLITRRDIRSVSGAGLDLTLQVPDTNPFYVNPAGGTDPVTVLYGSGTDFGPLSSTNRIDTGNFTAGLTLSTPVNWTVNGYVSYAFENQHEVLYGQVNQTALDAALADPNPATAFNPFGDGPQTNQATVAAIRGSTVYDVTSTLKSASVTAIGPLVRLPGGTLEATVGAEYRLQALNSTLIFPDPAMNSDPRSDLRRRISAAFTELRIPLFGTPNAVNFARKLEISLGMRREEFSDVAGDIVPKVGFLWSPVASLNLRGTWTRSFRPPGLPDLIAKTNYSELVTIPDNSAPSGQSAVLARFGTNPGLHPEQARSWTVGADWTPQDVPGLALSLTYFDVHYTDRIDEPQLSTNVLQQPQYSWLVERNFTAAELRDACVNSVYLGTPGTCLTTPIAAILDARLLNISSLRTDGFDLIARYDLPIARGRLELGFNGTYLLKYSLTNTPGSPPLDALSTQNYPIDLRVRTSAAWVYRNFSLAGYLNHANSYRDTLSVPGRGVGPWTSVDLQLGYETDADPASWLARLQLFLNVQNVFDRNPPFLNNPIGVGYDQENAELYGRIVSVVLRKRW